MIITDLTGNRRKTLDIHSPASGAGQQRARFSGDTATLMVKTNGGSLWAQVANIVLRSKTTIAKRGDANQTAQNTDGSNGIAMKTSSIVVAIKSVKRLELAAGGDRETEIWAGGVNPVADRLRCSATTANAERRFPGLDLNDQRRTPRENTGATFDVQAGLMLPACHFAIVRAPFNLDNACRALEKVV